MQYAVEHLNSQLQSMLCTLSTPDLEDKLLPSSFSGM